MAQNLLSLIVTLLAVFGCLALLARLGRALLRVGLNAATATAVSGFAEVSERRGDITGVVARRAAQDTLRRARRVENAWALGYLLLLAVPLFGGFAREAYAVFSLLWFLPDRHVRPRLDPAHPGAAVQAGQAAEPATGERFRVEIGTRKR